MKNFQSGVLRRANRQDDQQAAWDASRQPVRSEREGNTMFSYIFTHFPQIVT